MKNGFTLIELMIVLALVAILLAAATPSFRTMIQDNRISTRTSELLTAMNLARAEAVKRGVPITVCPSADGATCQSTKNWNGGWILFADRDGDQINDGGDPNEVLLKRRENYGDGAVIVATDNQAIQFGTDGTMTDTAARTLQICDSRGAEHAQAVIVTASGQTRGASDQGGDGIVEDHSNSNVTCS